METSLILQICGLCGGIASTNLKDNEVYVKLRKSNSRFFFFLVPSEFLPDFSKYL